MRRQQTTQPPTTVIPRPTFGYDQSYMNVLVRALQQQFDFMSNPSVLRGGDLFLSNIPTRGAGLAPGYVFSDSGILKIVRQGDIYAESFSFTVSVGTVTVTT